MSLHVDFHAWEKIEFEKRIYEFTDAEYELIFIYICLGLDLGKD